MGNRNSAVASHDKSTGRGSSEPTHNRERDNVLAVELAARGRTRGGGGSKRGSSKSSTPTGLLSDDELRELDERFAAGITAVQIVDIFSSRGLRFSEATFRKYVQQGLLPRSRRVGRKGKHRGSLGVYPAKTIRRINAIKSLMGDGYTIEQIQEQFLRFTDVIESLEEGITDLFGRLETEVQAPRFDNQTRRNLKREISEARKTADELMRRIEPLARRFTALPSDQYSSTGAAGSAEDLL